MRSGTDPYSEVQFEELNSLLTENQEMLKQQNRDMAEQNKVLQAVSQISRKLFMLQSNGNFESLVKECLCLMGESIHKSGACIWKDQTNEDGKVYCVPIYEWQINNVPIHSKHCMSGIAYDILPAFGMGIHVERCLNSRKGDFSEIEMRVFDSNGKEIMVAPIFMNDKRWGFLMVDNYENNSFSSSIEEIMLLMGGSMFASAIENMKTEEELREMEEHTQLMLNATPLCCNLWTTHFTNMRCNDEAVRLFGLSSQKEYLERFYDLSPEYQLNGRRSDELAKENIIKAFQEGYCRFEWQHKKLDKTPIPAEITLVRIKYKDDFIVAGYTRDLREEKAMLAEIKTKEALRIARDEALLNSKAKSNFLANMSHEIRTPMNAISGFAEIILRESAGRKTVKYAQGIKDACGNLINIVNDILDISKIESGKLEIYNTSYELASMLNDVITISSMRLRGKALMFITDIDSRLPAKVVGDEVRVRQILINMLTNAMKYTDEGYVAFRVTGSVVEDQAILQFTIKDSGVGIKPDDLECLFEEFQRVNTTKNRSIEGTGLGLAISKQLCEMMGGHIRVESIYGKGSEFVVEIPQECPSYEPLAQVKDSKNVLLYEPRERYRFSIIETLENLGCKCLSCSSQSELYNNIDAMPFDYILTAALHLKKVQEIVQRYELQVIVAAFADYGEAVDDESTYTILFPVNCLQLSGLLNGQHEESMYMRDKMICDKFSAPTAKILIVDDNPVNLQVAKGLMEPYQFMMETAENGKEAIDRISHTEYDLVFMDHMMPEMDGIDATAAIRQMRGEYYKNLPIIALTANALVGTREMFIQEGMNDFLPKPIEIKKLVKILLHWLPKSKIEKCQVSETIKDTTEIPEWVIAGIDVKKGIEAVGGNKENYLQILSYYYADGKQKCNSLVQHLKINNITAFRTEVHALKSTSAAIGAFLLSSKAEKLETAAQNHDVNYIHDNMDNFLNAFHVLLEGIWPVISGDLVQEFSTENKAIGDVLDLKESLETLKEALDYANISQIEEILEHLYRFTWIDEITKELKEMKKHLSVFDYDRAIECAIHLQAL